MTGNSNAEKVWGWIENCRGHEKAMTAKTISRISGVPERVVRQIISELRREGFPIASAVSPPYGYYIPENIREAKECQRHLRSRIRQLEVTAKSFDRAINKNIRKQARQRQLSF